MENEFRIKKDNIEISFSGNQKFVENQLKEWKDFILEIFSINTNNQEIENKKEENNIIRVKRNINIRDFFDLKKPNSIEDEVITLAYFLEKYEKKEYFSLEDITNILKHSNIEKYLEINVENGYLQRIKNNDSKYCYTLTYSGEIYVKEGLL